MTVHLTPENRSASRLRPRSLMRRIGAAAVSLMLAAGLITTTANPASAATGVIAPACNTAYSQSTTMQVGDTRTINTASIIFGCNIMEWDSTYFSVTDPNNAAASSPATLTSVSGTWTVTAIAPTSSTQTISFNRATPSPANRHEYFVTSITGPPPVPTGVTATAGPESGVVSWTASSGADSYTVTASPGGATCTATAPAVTCTVTGLTTGSSYTFTATATNTSGTSAASTASGSVTALPPLPSVPTGVTATAGPTKATVSWTASTGNPVTYTVTSTPGSLTCTATAPATTCDVTGLTNGTSYTFAVTATSPSGTTAASTPSSSVTILAPPAAPTGVTATAGQQSAVVSWTASTGTPASYTATSSPGGLTCTVADPGTSCTVSGLTAGTSYTFEVTATNSGGTSSASTPSSMVTMPSPSNGGGSGGSAVVMSTGAGVTRPSADAATTAASTETSTPAVVPTRSVKSVVSFYPGSATLNARMQSRLNGAILRAGTKVVGVTVIGYYPANASAATKALAKKRANAVAAYVRAHDKHLGTAPVTVRTAVAKKLADTEAGIAEQRVSTTFTSHK